MKMRKALIVVDVQNDFYETGSLPVSGASQINEAINRAMRDSVYEAIVAGQDWHPSNHMSFAVNHGKEPFTPFDNKKGIGPVLWPVHCQQGTHGAAFHTNIETNRFDYIIRKGTHPHVDSYSIFRENDGTELGTDGLLRALGIEELDICGLALDYCLKYTVHDALLAGFKINVIINGTKGVEANIGDVQRTIEEFRRAGVELIER
jgi:nicotinamidase/pyrazinamidase